MSNQPNTNLALRVPPEHLRDAVELMRKFGEDELLAAFRESVKMTVEQVSRMAAVVFLMEEAGSDLAELECGYVDYLRLVAHGQLSPLALRELGAKPEILDKVAKLPMPDQEELVGATVQIVSLKDGGDGIYRWSKPVILLTKKEAELVFADRHVRGEEEQVQWLRLHPPRSKSRRLTSGEAVLLVDKKKGGLVVRVGKDSVFLTESEVLGALQRLAAD